MTEYDNLSIDDVSSGNNEYTIDLEIELEPADSTVCPHCNEVSEIPDPSLLTKLELDVPCLNCGFPLQVVL